MKNTIITLLFCCQIASAEVQINKAVDGDIEVKLSGGTRVNLVTGDYNNFFVRLPAPQDRDVQTVLNKLDQMNQDYGHALGVPKTLKLKIWSAVGPEVITEVPFDTGIPAAGFDYVYNEMVTGTRYGNKGQESAEQWLPVTVHEYGHVLFHNLLESSIPKLTVFLDEHRELRQAMDRFMSVFGYKYVCSDGKLIDPDRVFRVFGTKDIFPKIESICAELIVLEQKAALAKQKAATAESNLLELSKYHELFADVVAVVDSDDLDVMAKVTGEKARSFKTCGAVRTDGSRPYDHFRFTRCEIGILYARAVKRGTAKSDFLKRVGKVVTSTLAESVRQHSGEVYLSPLGASADEILIRRLQMEFGK